MIFRQDFWVKSLNHSTTMLRKVLIKQISFVEYFYKPELYFPNPVQALINELFERNIRVIELSGAK